MTLKQLLAAYKDIYCCIITPTNTHFIECSYEKKAILAMYGEWLVEKFYAFAYDVFDGYLKIYIEEDNASK